MKLMPKNPSRVQRGSVLLVSIVILVLLTLIVLSAIKLTNVNTRVAANMQLQLEAEAAAQQEIERVLNVDFTAAPASSVRTTTIDVNQDNKPDFNVVTQVPKCVTSKPLRVTELDLGSSSDRACMTSGAAQNTGIATAAPSGNSLCAETIWELSATATDANGSGVEVTTTQGVAVRVAAGVDCPS